MKTVKKLALIVALSLPTVVNASGVPVVDGAAAAQRQMSMLQTIQQWAKEAKQWTDTVNHYKSQLKAYADQLEATTGVRDLKEFISDVKSIYQDYETAKSEVISAVEILKNGKSALKGEALRLFEQYQVFDRCKHSNLVAQNLCESEVANNVEQVVRLSATEKRISKKMQELDSLSKRIAKAKDMKEAQDLGNTMQLKIASLQAEKLQFDIQQAQQATYERLVREQKRQLMAKREIHGKIPTFK
ncbi:transport associated protein 4 [Rodentibacter rarus]|uniref:Transport associated protein 4 n=1 Tax=Rodentibacter rarus TaxID=1908260 RepID=A0A1V3IGB9_9PAST|nr:type IV secretion system protein [Rodentibacter rarus]OOF40056.1 transport associated protein 4 [Rodentibacter rarus]